MINKLRPFRFVEISLVFLFGAIGVVYANPTGVIVWRTWVYVSTGMWLLYYAIWNWNSYLGYHQDANNSRLQNPFQPRRCIFAAHALVALAIALVIITQSCGPDAAIVGGASFFLWATYSYPTLGLKNMPVGGTIVHFVTGVAHFNIAYWAFEPPTSLSLGLGCYFAALFAAGHFYHEALDYDADSSQQIRTGAVFWGKRTGIKLSIATIVLAALLALTQLVGQVRAGLLTPFLFANAAHFVAYFYFAGDLENNETIMRFQQIYRAFYVAAGIVVLAMRAATI